MKKLSHPNSSKEDVKGLFDSRSSVISVIRALACLRRGMFKEELPLVEAEVKKTLSSPASDFVTKRLALEIAKEHKLRGAIKELMNVIDENEDRYISKKAFDILTLWAKEGVPEVADAALDCLRKKRNVYSLQLFLSFARYSPLNFAEIMVDALGDISLELNTQLVFLDFIKEKFDKSVVSAVSPKANEKAKLLLEECKKMLLSLSMANMKELRDMKPNPPVLSHIVISDSAPSSSPSLLSEEENNQNFDPMIFCRDEVAYFSSILSMLMNVFIIDEKTEGEIISFASELIARKYYSSAFVMAREGNSSAAVLCLVHLNKCLKEDVASSKVKAERTSLKKLSLEVEGELSKRSVFVPLVDKPM